MTEVLYCGVCGLPPEYCEFGPDFNKCKPWIAANCPEIYPDLKLDEVTEQLADSNIDAPPAPAAPAKKGKSKEVTPEVVIYSEQRAKRKFVTSIYGLQFFDIKLKDAAKFFSKKCSSGCTVSEDASMKKYLQIQGDLVDDCVEYIKKEYKIPDDKIFTLDEKKKKIPYN